MPFQLMYLETVPPCESCHWSQLSLAASLTSLHDGFLIRQSNQVFLKR